VPPPVERGPNISRFSFGVRLGAQIMNSSTASEDCSGSCAGFVAASTDYSISTAPALGLDFLVRVGEILRIGPSLVYTHKMDYEPSTGASREFGSLSTLNGAAEVVARVAPKVWLVPRIELGLMAYNATGAAAEAESNAKAQCAPRSSTGCDGIESPHFGFDLGGSFGVMFAVSTHVRIRFDAVAQYYSFDLGDSTESLNAQNRTITDNMSGSRYLVFGGFEL
jgi:hypothetical protein